MRSLSARRRFRDLKLFWKLLVPFFLVIVVLGSAGSFLIVRFLSARAQDAFDQDLFRRAVQAEAHVFDRSLYVLDSVRLGANFEGVPEAVQGRDRAGLSEALAGVPAARPDLDLVVATDDRGVGLVEIVRSGDGYERSDGSAWADRPFVRDVLGGLVDEAGDKRVGFDGSSGTVMFATAGPIKRDGRVVGAVIAGLGVPRLASEISERVGGTAALYDTGGNALGQAGRAGTLPPPPAGSGARPVRVSHSIGDVDMATSYAELTLRGQRLGTVAVSLPDQAAFSPVRGATSGLVLMLLTAMAAISALGALLSRYILRQVKPLIETNRRLGRGDLSARAPLVSADELGELTRGFNAMASQLQASHEELESRVAQRTDELQRLHNQMVKANEERAELFAMISHEFRSPLTAIIGHADVMLNPRFDPADEKWRGEFGAAIKGAGEDLLGHVNEILDIAKLESGKMELDIGEVSLADLIHELEGTITALASQGELKVTFDVPRDLPPVRGDRTRLRQIVLNLVSNAVKYTPAGGRVTLAVSQQRGRVEVSVSDTGVGIPKKAGNRVFEPFYQVSGTKTQKGQASSGLGLSLTKRLVEAHRGKIWYTSEPGRGTTFTFSLRPFSKGSKVVRPTAVRPKRKEKRRVRRDRPVARRMRLVS